MATLTNGILSGLLLLAVVIAPVIFFAMLSVILFTNNWETPVKTRVTISATAVAVVILGYMIFDIPFFSFGTLLFGYGIPFVSMFILLDCENKAEAKAKQDKENKRQAEENKRQAAKTAGFKPGTILLNTDAFNSSVRYKSATFADGKVYVKTSDGSSLIIGYYEHSDYNEVYIFDKNKIKCGKTESSRSEMASITLDCTGAYEYYERLYGSHDDIEIRHPREFSRNFARAYRYDFEIRDSTHWGRENSKLLATYTGDSIGAAAALVCLIKHEKLEPYYSFYSYYTKEYAVVRMY